MSGDDTERDVWYRNLAKVGIPEQYWDKIIEAAHDLDTLAEDGMRVVWDRETMHGPSVLPAVTDNPHYGEGK